MGGWGCGGTLVSKGFGYQKEPDYCGYDEYPLRIPTIILDGFENGSTQGWGDSHIDNVIVKRDHEIVVYKRTIRWRRWIEFNGKKVLCDEEDVPEGCKTLDFEKKNEIIAIVYDLESKTKCVFKMDPVKEYVPYDERDIKKYLDASSENLYPTSRPMETMSISSEKQKDDNDLPF